MMSSNKESESGAVPPAATKPSAFADALSKAKAVTNKVLEEGMKEKELYEAAKLAKASAVNASNGNDKLIGPKDPNMVEWKAHPSIQGSCAERSCNFKLLMGDTHDVCANHTKCIVEGVFDPRN